MSSNARPVAVVTRSRASSRERASTRSASSVAWSHSTPELARRSIIEPVMPSTVPTAMITSSACVRSMRSGGKTGGVSGQVVIIGPLSARAAFVACAHVGAAARL
jgi:hypothetical protein